MNKKLENEITLDKLKFKKKDLLEKTVKSIISIISNAKNFDEVIMQFEKNTNHIKNILDKEWIRVNVMKYIYINKPEWEETESYKIFEKNFRDSGISSEKTKPIIEAVEIYIKENHKKIIRDQDSIIDNLRIDRINIYNDLIKANNRIIELTNDKEEKIRIMNENLILNDKLTEYQKQLGFMNQYFNAWESESINIRKGYKSDFYYNEFIIDKPELRDVTYKQFTSNLKSQKSQRLNALRITKSKNHSK